MTDHAGIRLLPELPNVPLAELQGSAPVIACDCYVSGIEAAGTAVEWGWRIGVSENIDHHAPVQRMARQVSSANLAATRVREIGVVGVDSQVLLTHTDCDSVLSAAIVSGRLPPAQRYEDAAIAADHTGAVDPIADLLQAVQKWRDVERSLRALSLLESGGPLPEEAKRELDGRNRKREIASEAVATGRFSVVGRMVWAEFTENVDGEFFPSLLPDAELIVTGFPHPKLPGRWAIKVRLGLASPPGATLNDLDIRGFDPAYGGRWNAGSNKKGGGTLMGVEEWVRHSQLSRQAFPEVPDG